MKKTVLTLAKLGIALALVYWMVSSGKLRFSDLRIALDQPLILLSCAAQWIAVTMVLCPIRWLALLRGLSLPVPAWRSIQLSLVGTFFNSVMPGAVGGDIIKAAYVIRDQQSRKTPAMMTIVLDRVVGMMGLFVIGTVAILANLNRFWSMPLLRPIVLMVFSAMAGMLAIYAAALRPTSDDRDPILKILRLKVAGMALWQRILRAVLAISEKIYVALRSYRERPSALFLALGFAVVGQLISMFTFVFITEIYTQQTVDLAQFASVFPIGLVTTALPLAPGGLGVGHIAFEKLYELIGLHGGANVFNLFFLTQISLSLLGAIPYLTLGKQPQASA